MNQNLFDSEHIRNDIELTDNNNRKTTFKNVSFGGHLALLTNGGKQFTTDNVYLTSDRSGKEPKSPRETSQKRDASAKGRYANIEEGLESSVGNEAKERIQKIVNEVKLLSDVEKLLLYLRLPSGESQGEDLRQTPTPCQHTSNRAEQAQAYTWIKSHLEEDVEICLPKHEVYEDYKLYCDNHTIKPLSTADFGKLMKNVFPNVKPRRLGQRGQSRYCYGGLRKKLDVEAPLLPDLEISPVKQQDVNEDEELYSASCQLVCEWAQKLLSQNFRNLRELSEYLITNMYVNHKSVSAFTVIASMQETGINKVSSLFANTTGGDRHRETQLQLQRKLQERELLREQKRKLQQQKEENERARQDRQTPITPSPGRDGQTPLLISPSQAQEHITPIISSPNIIVATPSANCGAEKSNFPRSKSVSSCEAKTVTMVTDHSSARRNRSTSVFEFSSAVLSSNTDSAKDIEMLEVHNDKERDDRPVSESKSVEAMEVNLESSGQFVVSENFNENDASFTNVKSRKPAVVNKALSQEDTRPALQSSFHTIRKPAVISPCGLSASQKADVESPVVENVPAELTKPSFSNDTNTSFSSAKDAVSFGVSVAPLPEKPSVLHFPAQPSSVCVKLFDYKQEDVQKANEEVVHLNTPSATSRSAFVPFSQVHGRKDTSNEVQFKSRIPSIVSTKSSFFPSSSASTNSPASISSVDMSDTKIEVEKVIKSGQSGNTIINPSTSQELHKDSPVSSERILKPPGSLTIPTSSSSSFSKINLVGTLPFSDSGQSVFNTQSQPVSQTSPSTPKKGKSRFPPIRPKASPQKTVSSILKEQKVGYEIGNYDKSKPVAALLKEKRAREAEAMAQQMKTSISLSPGAPNPHNIQIQNLQNFAAVQNNIQNSQPGEFLIILNPATTTGQVSVVTPVTKTVATTPVSGIVRSKSELGISSTTSYSQSSRSRTNSSSELEIESFLPPAIDEDMDVNNDEKPSKLAKIVDSDHNVSSRPGSRCSLDRETPSFGRKRKLHNNGSVGQHKRINSIEDTDDDVISDKESMRRAKSCSLESSDKPLNKDLSAEIQYCPDISILEIDALSDDVAELEHHALKVNDTQSCQQVQSAAVGVNSLSLRNSQQQLLKQKEALDRRMKNFLNKDEKNKKSQMINSSLAHKKDGRSIYRDHIEQSHGVAMDTESELPPDVADFITDALTGLNTEKSERNTDHERKMLRQLTPVTMGVNESRVVPSASPSSVFMGNQMASPLSRRAEKDCPAFGSASLTSQIRKDASNFVSPQRPVRRQRTPSVERIMNPPDHPQHSPLDRILLEGGATSNSSFQSPNHASFMKRRESSVERLNNQTPFSDAGYGSIGASPIMNSTPVSSIGLCDTTLNSTSSTGVYMSRPDSVQSLASDTIQQSPIPPFSPRNNISTPLTIRSPCQTPNKTELQSPVTPGQPTRAFMPIQNLAQKIDGNVRLIKPIVTLASSINVTMTEGIHIKKDLIGISSIQPNVKPPPPYNTAVQSLKNFLKSENPESVPPSAVNYQTGSVGEKPIITESSGLPSVVQNGESFASTCPCSFQLAVMSMKSLEVQSGKDAADKGVFKPTSKQKKMTQNSVLKEPPPLRNSERKASRSGTGQIDFQFILSNLKEQENPYNSTNRLHNTTNTSNLASTFYNRNLPNLAEHHVEKVKGHFDKMEDDVEFSARRNLTDLLEEPSSDPNEEEPSSDFNVDELQSTLEDLRSVDEKYFSQDNFDMDFTSKRI